MKRRFFLKALLAVPAAIAVNKMLPAIEAPVRINPLMALGGDYDGDVIGWCNIVNSPDKFSPEIHTHGIDDIIGNGHLNVRQFAIRYPITS